MMSLTWNKKTFIAFALAVALIATLIGAGMTSMTTQVANAEVPSLVPYNSYNIVSYNKVTSSSVPDQYVDITFTYQDAVTVTDAAAAAGAFTITIANGAAAANPSPPRPLTVSASGNDLVLTLGPSPSGTTAIMGGKIQITASAGALAAGIEIGNGDTPAAIDLTTVIPTGATLNLATSTQGNNPATIFFNTSPQVRGIVNIGIYKAGPGNTLVPIDTGLNNKIVALANPSIPVDPTGFITDLNTYIVHFTNFQNVTTPQNVANEVYSTLINTSSTNSVPLLTGYTVVNNGNGSISITSPNSGEALYVYIMDDNLIQAIDQKLGGLGNVTYNSIVANNGILPVAVP